MARRLVLMGSGETTPTMVETHKRVLAEVGPSPRAIMLDTPYGFQENADELTARTVEYFARSAATTVTPVSLSDASALSAAELGDVAARVEDADWVFAGPGSPTYLRRQWEGTDVPDALRRRLGRDGATVFASAAVCSVGMRTVPVYEIYKVGQPPHWEDGFDLTGELGLRCVVIPHFDNAEGGTHDTRFCYLGERRLAAMEAELPDDVWVLGVDEHTALVIDLETRTTRIEGRGVVTVRHRDRHVTFAPGDTPSLDDLADGGHRRGPPRRGGGVARDDPRARPVPGGARRRTRPCSRPSTDTSPPSRRPWRTRTHSRPPTRSWPSRRPSTPGRPTRTSPTRSTAPGARCTAWSPGWHAPRRPGCTTTASWSPRWSRSCWTCATTPAPTATSPSATASATASRTPA